MSQPSLYWQKTFGGSLSETRALVRATSDKGCILGGFSFSSNGDIPSNAGGQDFAFFKLDACGNREWTKVLGWSSLDLVYGINEIPGGDFYFSGTSSSTSIAGHHGGMDGIIGKLDAVGNLSWIKTFGGSSNEVLLTNVVLPDSSCIAAGWTASTNGDGGAISGGSDGWIIKIDKSGNLVWKKFFGGALGDAFFDIAPTNDGGFIAAGNTSITVSNSDFFVVKIDADGNTVWQKTYGGPLVESARTVRACNAGGYMIGGTTNSNSGDVSGNHGSTDAWIIKLDEYGNLLWQKCIGGSQQEDLWEMSAPGNDQYIFAAGTSSTDGDLSTNQGTQDALAFCLDSDGNLKWLKNYGGTASDVFFSVSATNEGTVFLSGHSGSNDGDISGNHGNADFILFKLQPVVQRQVDTSSCKPFMLFNHWVSSDTSLSFPMRDVCGHDSAMMHYNITVLPPAFVQSIPDITIGAGEQVILTTTAAAPVQWTGPGLSCSSCLSPVVHPLIDSRYIVTTTGALCNGLDTVNVHVVVKDSMYIPTAFTPNGDGLNDAFKAIGSAADFNMKIYNRWGEEIFQSNSITNGWNGTIAGKKQPTGLYVFLIRYKNGAGKWVQQKGTVLLVR